MNNKVIAWGLTISWGVGVMNALTSDLEGLYTLAGLGALVFSIMAIVQLFKEPVQK